jgi:hypothetical protein
MSGCESLAVTVTVTVESQEDDHSSYSFGRDLRGGRFHLCVSQIFSVLVPMDERSDSSLGIS